MLTSNSANSSFSSVRSRILAFQQNDQTKASSSFNDSPIPQISSNKVNDSSSIVINRKISEKSEELANDSVETGSKMDSSRKKTSMKINLSNSSVGSNMFNSGNKGKASFSTSGSSIPKLIPSPTSLPTISEAKGNSFLSSNQWKAKFEEAENKRLHIMTLAHKATRDYEELRRRYQDLVREHELTSNKLSHVTIQLEALRNASEAAYIDYHKLRKHYENENNAKSEALTRVDQYNRENRRLKRQSAALMQHFQENVNVEDLLNIASSDEKEDHQDSEKDVNQLRLKIEELEGRIVELESELEKAKLSEFESTEAALLSNDSVQSSKCLIQTLKDNLHKEKEYNGQLILKLKEVESQLEILKNKEASILQKLEETNAQLRLIETEKNVLQRQSVVLTSQSGGRLDSQLEEAMNQIQDLQFQFEEQKLNYESQVLELEERNSELEALNTTNMISSDAKIKSLEALVAEIQAKLEDSQKKEERQNLSAIPPPPPPPPMNFNPPVPPPSVNGLDVSNVTLRRVKKPNPCQEEVDPEKSIIPSSVVSPQIDDVVNAIKKGVKLRSAENRTVNRREPNKVEESKRGDSIAVEEMRSILNNLRRTGKN